jgi:hypothetical protein
VSSRPFAPIWQVALLGPTLALTVVQVAVIWTAPAPPVSDTWLGHGFLASFGGGVIMITLALLAMRRAAPMLPGYRRISSRMPAEDPDEEATVEFWRHSPR